MKTIILTTAFLATSVATLNSVTIFFKDQLFTNEMHIAIYKVCSETKCQVWDGRNWINTGVDIAAGDTIFSLK